MAYNKKKVIVYTDWIDTFENLSDEEAGALIKHFFRYVNDLNPETDNRIVNLMFIPMKATLKRDLIAWESKQEKNRENGKLGGRPPKLKETQINPTVILETQLNPEKGVSVSDTVSVNDILLEKETKDLYIEKFNFKKSLLDFGFKDELVTEWIQVRKAKKATNTETALKGFMSEVKKSGRSPDEILTICIENSWKGFKTEWITNLNQNGKSNTNNQYTPRTADDKLAEAKRRILGDDYLPDEIQGLERNFEDADYTDV